MHVQRKNVRVQGRDFVGKSQSPKSNQKRSRTNFASVSPFKRLRKKKFPRGPRKRHNQRVAAGHEASVVVVVVVVVVFVAGPAFLLHYHGGGHFSPPVHGSSITAPPSSGSSRPDAVAPEASNHDGVLAVRTHEQTLLRLPTVPLHSGTWTARTNPTIRIARPRLF